MGEALNLLSVEEKLAAIIRFPTIASPEGEQEDAAAFAACREAILNMFPNLIKSGEHHLIKGRGLVIRFPGETAENPWALMAHYDVVPAKEEGWLTPPFAGLIQDGFVIGRGTLDTKGTLICMLEAAEQMAAAGQKPRQDILFCFSADEETYGPTALDIIDFLKEKGWFPAFVLDEGGKLGADPVPGFSGIAALVGVAEKGMAIIRLSVTGVGGHASTPPRETQTDILVQALNKIRQKPFPQRLIPMMRDFLSALSPGCQFPYRTMYKYPDAFSRMLFRLFGRLAGGQGAMLRTTCVLTQLSGSTATNVMPATATAGYNLRLLPGEDPEACRARLIDIIDDERVQVELIAGNPPSPVSNTSGLGFDNIKNAVSAVWPEVITAPSLVLGATDAYYYSLLCDRVYRFSPLLVDEKDLSGVHAANERVPVKALHDAVHFYQVLMSE